MPAALLTLLVLSCGLRPRWFRPWLSAVVLHFGVGLVHLFGSLAYGDFRIPAPLLWQSAAFCALLAAAIAAGSPELDRNEPWQRVLAWAALVLARRWPPSLPRPIDHPHNALLVEAIDVGQGDSLLLITPDGKTLLVDGGGFGGGPRQAPQDFDIGEEVVSPALWSRGIRHLDAVALSHAHSDHMGGLPAVLRNFHPDELWVGNNPRSRALTTRCSTRPPRSTCACAHSMPETHSPSAARRSPCSRPFPVTSPALSPPTTIHWCCTWPTAQPR